MNRLHLKTGISRHLYKLEHFSVAKAQMKHFNGINYLFINIIKLITIYLIILLYFI